jgi:hypothetical protein
LGTGKNFGTIDWDANLRTSNDPIFLYSGQFSKIDGSLILAGGSNANEAKLFDRNNLEKVLQFFLSIFGVNSEKLDFFETSKNTRQKSIYEVIIM